MCDPRTFSIGAQVLGSVLGAGGAYEQSSANKQALAIQSAVAAQNAQIARQQAAIALQIGQTEEQNQRLRTGQVLGAQRAAMAANGVDLGEGSPNDVLTTTKYVGERDSLAIRDNAARQAWGYQVQATNADNNALLFQHSSDAIDPTLSAATSLLGSAGQVASSWYSLSKARG